MCHEESCEKRAAFLRGYEDDFDNVRDRAPGSTFFAKDGEDEPTLWLTGPAGYPIAVLRRCELPREARHLWPLVPSGEDVTKPLLDTIKALRVRLDDMEAQRDSWRRVAERHERTLDRLRSLVIKQRGATS